MPANIKKVQWLSNKDVDDQEHDVDIRNQMSISVEADMPINNSLLLACKASTCQNKAPESVERQMFEAA